MRPWKRGIGLVANTLEGQNIVLGVTGSIACYKALDLASKLNQAGALVDTVMSYGATQFVTPLAFRSITHRPVVTDTFDPDSELSVEHIALAQRANIVVVAPATAHFIAKAAAGLADDPLTTTILATSAPVLIAPAMDGHMYDNPSDPGEPVPPEDKGSRRCGTGRGEACVRSGGHGQDGGNRGAHGSH